MWYKNQAAKTAKDMAQIWRIAEALEYSVGWCEHGPHFKRSAPLAV